MISTCASAARAASCPARAAWGVLLGVVSAIGLAAASAVPSPAVSRPPNVVLIFLDDSGYGDFHPLGRPAYPTPNVERLAAEGCRFENFYVPQAVCSASRAALLSGCYPGRTRVFGAHPPRARGLDPKYATIGEVLKRRGYATAVFGKWHIGDQPETRPPARGFDESCGLMYSNDMWEYHPENPRYWSQWPLQFWNNGQVTIERVTPDHQPLLTTWYTERAVDFIRRHNNTPFFLYVPHSMPHVPLFCSGTVRGRSGVGLYGDVMRDIDASVGRILKALADTGVAGHTLVIMTSDNGPWISYGNHAGATPFREAKGTTFDGGVRSACLMRFPGRIRPGSVSKRAFGTIDLLPTLAHLAGAALPENPVDGKNVWDLIRGEPDAAPPHAYYPLSTGSTFEGVISGDGRWKLHLPHKYRTLVAAGKDGAAGRYKTVDLELSLFDLDRDPLESTNVIGRHPEVAARLQALAEQHRQRFYVPSKPR
ncbi:MAG: sulfatase [Verrucomicrobia bacterium]|nr:sulfatase [Verrucomicrobiota bacterium]